MIFNTAGSCGFKRGRATVWSGKALELYSGTGLSHTLRYNVIFLNPPRPTVGCYLETDHEYLLPYPYLFNFQDHVIKSSTLYDIYN
jgi:hypothetical protein